MWRTRWQLTWWPVVVPVYLAVLDLAAGEGQGAGATSVEELQVYQPSLQTCFEGAEAVRAEEGEAGALSALVWGQSLVRPAYTLDRSAVFGTRTSDSWCGRCDYTATFWLLLSYFHDR